MGEDKKEKKTRTKQKPDQVTLLAQNKKLYQFGQQIRQFRLILGMDQEQFATHIGLSGKNSRSAISRLERGIQHISFIRMVDICMRCGYELTLNYRLLPADPTGRVVAQGASATAGEVKVLGPVNNPAVGNPVEINKQIDIPENVNQIADEKKIEVIVEKEDDIPSND